jgi:hypothetical protein
MNPLIVECEREPEMTVKRHPLVEEWSDHTEAQTASLSQYPQV